MTSRPAKRHSVPKAVPIWEPDNRRYFDYIDQQDRLTYSERRAAARADWADFKGRVPAIRPVPKFDRDEYPGVPRSLWKASARNDLDHYAGEFGFQYASDFVAFVEALHNNLVNTRAAPEKPAKLPKLRHHRHGRGRQVKITRKHSMTKPAGGRVTADGRKWVYVKAHKRSCPA